MSIPTSTTSPDSITKNPPSIQAWFFPALLLVLIATVAYLPSLNNGYIWDDDHYVTRNLTLRDLNGLSQIWFKIGAVPQYYPLVHTTFWIEYHLWGLNPLGFHLVNVLLHAGAAVLLWRILARLELQGAWLAAAIFALHPVHVESVAWITERKNVLSAILYFAAALSYFRFSDLRQDDASRTRSRYFYLAALLLFVASLWSKTVTCSLPAALLLVRWWKQGSLTRRDVLPLLPFFIIGAGLSYLTIWMEKHTVGASGAAWDMNILERCFIAGRALWFYAAKLVCPAKLTFIYPRWDIDTAVWWQWLFPIVALAVVVLLWVFRARIGRGPLTAVLYFAGTLFPALGFINVYPFRYSFVADHFQYLASVGLIVLASEGLTRTVTSLGASVNLQRELKPVLLVIPLILSMLTWKQIHIYRDQETLWRDTLAKSPNSAIAHNNLGTLLSERGEPVEAEQHYREALRIEPDDPETLSNLGVALSTQGHADEALQFLNKALSMGPSNPEVHCNLGRVFAGQGRYNEAIAAFQKAIELSPERAQFYYDLGTVLATIGKNDEAIEHFRKALERRPNYTDACNNLGLALARQGKYQEAAELFARTLQIDPNHALAHNNLGDALMRLRDLDQAIVHFNEALRLNPSYVNARFNLGNALALQKRYDEAIAQFTETLRLSPDHIQAHRNLGLALARTGRREAAAEHFKAVLRLQPDNEEVKQYLRALEPQSAQ